MFVLLSHHVLDHLNIEIEYVTSKGRQKCVTGLPQRQWKVIYTFGKSTFS